MGENPTTQPEVGFDLSKLSPTELQDLLRQGREINKRIKAEQDLKVKEVGTLFADFLAEITKTVTQELDLVQSGSSDWAGYTPVPVDLVLADPETGAPTKFHVKVTVTNVTLSEARKAQPAGDPSKGLDPWKKA